MNGSFVAVTVAPQSTGVDKPWTRCVGAAPTCVSLRGWPVDVANRISPSGAGTGSPSQAIGLKAIPGGVVQPRSDRRSGPRERAEVVDQLGSGDQPDGRLRAADRQRLEQLTQRDRVVARVADDPELVV